MRAAIAAALAASLVLAGCAGPRGQAAGIGAGLGGQAGLRVSVYASGLANVAALALDQEGRLWAATAAYSDEGADGLYLVTGPGADPVEVVAGLRTPLGLAWLDGWLYVASLGRVDAFSGFDGTRFAQRRTVLDGPVAGAENNGLVVTADGRLLMGVSAPCDHCVPASSWSAAIVSFAPDGSDLRLYARRIRAPFGLAADPGAGGLLVTMNQRDDLGGSTPGDWLALVREGQDWGFPDCHGQGGGACAGVPAPLAVLGRHAAAGSVAIAGGAAIVTEWATGRVLRVALPSGGTPAAYVTGMKHPLPVLAAAGGVLAGDWWTGRVYRISA